MVELLLIMKVLQLVDQVLLKIVPSCNEKDTSYLPLLLLFSSEIQNYDHCHSRT